MKSMAPVQLAVTRLFSGIMLHFLARLSSLAHIRLWQKNQRNISSGHRLCWPALKTMMLEPYPECFGIIGRDRLEACKRLDFVSTLLANLDGVPVQLENLRRISRSIDTNRVDGFVV